MLLRKRRAVRLPLNNDVRTQMTSKIASWKAEYDHNNLINNGDVAVLWIGERKKDSLKNVPFYVTKCSNGKYYLDIVLMDSEAVLGEYTVPKCRPLYRIEKYQIQTTDCYLNEWVELLRMVEYMYDANENTHPDCFDPLFDPDSFYREQKIVDYQVVTDTLTEMGEEGAKTSLFDQLEESCGLIINGNNLIAKAVMEDRFIVNRDFRVVYWTYYNPDSNAGGQFVHNRITFEQINADTSKDFDAFFDHLGSIACQTLTDLGTVEFVDTAYQVLTQPADLTGLSDATMFALKRIAQKYS